jgi:hypothetical protein
LIVEKGGGLLRLAPASFSLLLVSCSLLQLAAAGRTGL